MKKSQIRIKRNIAVATLFLLLFSCSSDGRMRTVRTTFVGVNAARDGFITWDAAHQADIVDQATSLDEGTAALRAYRQAREPVLAAFTIVYKVVAVAALDPSDFNVINMLERAKELYDLIRQLTGKPATVPR